MFQLVMSRLKWTLLLRNVKFICWTTPGEQPVNMRLSEPKARMEPPHPFGFSWGLKFLISLASYKPWPDPSCCFQLAPKRIIMYLGFYFLTRNLMAVICNRFCLLCIFSMQTASDHRNLWNILEKHPHP